MKASRILTLSLSLSVLALSACKGGASADAVKLVPDSAEFIVGVSPKALAGSDIYSKFSSQFESEDDYKEFIATFKDCGLDPLAFEAVVVGANQGGDFVVVIAGDSVGKEDEATCVIKSVQKAAGETEAAEVVKESGLKVINFTDGRAFLVNDNMLALASTEWQDSVGELIDGKGTSAIENSKKDLMAKVDTKKAVWFVATVPAEVAGMAAMAGPEATEIKTVAGTVDVSSGLALELVAGFDAEDKAKAAADLATSTLDMAKGEVPPDMKGMVDSLKIEASGSDVKISVAASSADLDTIVKNIPM